MTNTLYREYRFKFYLNASHYIIINGKEGQLHPHTWEFMVDILMNSKDFVQFDAYEKAIDAYFEKYQNHVINEIPPFDHTVPTLENMADYFIYDIRDIVEKLDGVLVKMECSETPTRSYIISFEKDQGFIDNIRAQSKDKIDAVIDSVINSIIE